MRESAADLAVLQELIDRSYASAGAHLQRIHTPERRLTAEQVTERLTGMTLLALATTTADGRPLVGPVDVGAPEGAELRRTLLDVYVPRYGPEWERFLDSGVAYARVDAERMFTFQMSAPA